LARYIYIEFNKVEGMRKLSNQD